MQPVYDQPKQGGFQPDSYQKPPSDHLILSILSTIFCNFCFGLVAIFYSVKTRENIRGNDLLNANLNAKTAFRLNIVSIVLGVLSIVLVVVIFAVTAHTAHRSIG